MSWFIVPPLENIVQVTGFNATLLTNLGLTPYATKALAEQAKSHGGALNQVLHPGQAKQQEQTLQQNAKDTAGQSGTLQDFFKRIANPNLWLRIGEGVLGLILIAAGMYSLTKNTGTGTAIKAVGKKVL